MTASILIIDDDKSIRKAFSMTLSDQYNVSTAADATLGLKHQQEQEPDLILLDINLPDLDGIQVLKKIKENSPDTVVIMITAFRDIKLVVEATKLGAFDYLVKPIDGQELRLTIKNGLENRSLKERLQLQQLAEKTQTKSMFSESSTAMREIFSLISKIAPNIDTPVLIDGDTGAGKGVLARKIHYSSPNSQGPFISVNCGSIASELVESELFGYAKGAFTGARSDGRKGRFEEAAGGTIFLDEIGVMPLSAQTRLLGVLEDRAFYRVGGNKEIKVTARVISATNLDLKKAVKEGTFRQDLLFRLNVITINIPPLKNRPEDILPLFKYFMQFYNKKNNKHFKTIPDETQNLLLHYEWPGNIRELRNIMERINLLEGGETILPEFLPFSAVDPMHSKTEFSMELDYEETKKRLIQQALQNSGGNITKAAQLLNMAPHKLRYRIKKMNITT